MHSILVSAWAGLVRGDGGIHNEVYLTSLILPGARREKGHT